MPHFKVESLLAARLFLQPQLAAGRVYFISDLSGRLSLYAMDRAGSVPEPLLPPDAALMTPTLLEGLPFYAFPRSTGAIRDDRPERRRESPAHGSCP